MAVTLGVVTATAVPLQQHALQRPVLLATQRQVEQVGMAACTQQRPRLFRFLTVDQPRQLADATALAEPPRVAQHHHLLRQRIGLFAAFQ
ncbi:hypothetical protein D3C75_1115950 [compost metagenome]